MMGKFHGEDVDALFVKRGIELTDIGMDVSRAAELAYKAKKIPVF